MRVSATGAGGGHHPALPSKLGSPPREGHAHGVPKGQWSLQVEKASKGSIKNVLGNGQMTWLLARWLVEEHRWCFKSALSHSLKSQKFKERDLETLQLVM